TVLKTDDWQDPGAYLDITKARWDNARTRLALPGNHTEGRVVVGMDYEHRLTLTKPIVRGGQNQAVLVGRTQVRDIEVAYKDGAYFELEVEQHGEPARAGVERRGAGAEHRVVEDARGVRTG
ncbi:hypothetical protein, partial [Chromobacterium amazonense]|uniref:phage nozzle protein n=1 Tax=Chromobacterium amazonense TaxID=1382803 RepID=UPI0031F6C362